eukprot:CAMPEP_0170558574 /NCGR_PEP_ID=MMETSP0211-20121228/36248_1 /TAXON_ID=311385 /ORGANISM="Pseudokeronopsis sp., Strain OXSARD2" /LENGTH=198 /DNA_ID=CAMNT_0010870647 /DNA_START=17 /DNA_END=613 /DNA_ORIENTATION=+
MTGMLLTGSANTILLKIQDETSAAAPNNGYPEEELFVQPFLQTLIMFLGELLCLGFYFGKLCWQNRKKGSEVSEAGKNELTLSPGTRAAERTHLKTNINPALLAIPAACDTVGSTLMNISLTMIDASIYQMIRGIIVLIVAGMAVVFLKRKQYSHHIVSLAVLFIGVFLVGLSTIVNPAGDGGESSTSALGIILLLIS